MNRSSRRATDSRCRQWVRRLGRDRRGVSALEFALILPILALFYAGAIELSLGMMADRKVSTTASTIGDLVSRGRSVTNCDVSDIFAAADLLMEPFGTDTMRLRVTSVVPPEDDEDEDEDEDDSDDGLTAGIVDWSFANPDWAPRAEGSEVTLPEDVLVNGRSVIMAEVRYGFVSPIGKIMDGEINMQEVHYLRPRRVSEIPFLSESCS